MWRDLNVDNLWEAFLEALRTVHYLEEEGAFDENTQEALEEDFNEAKEIARGIMEGLEMSFLEESSSSEEEELSLKKTETAQESSKNVNDHTRKQSLLSCR